MDPLTHGILGGVLVRAAWRERATARLTIAGIFGAMAPDLDVLIHSKSNPLLFFELHRQFTHCLAFIPIGGSLVALMLWLLWRRRFTLKSLCLAATLGYASHGLLDACTSYGTLLLWPFSSRRISWDIISIVDPLYTLTLIFGLWFALRRPRGRAAWIALGLSCLYLAAGLVQHHRALQSQNDLAQSRSQTPERGRVMPTLGNLLLWRSVYASEGNLYVDALRVGLGKSRYWTGGSLPGFSPDKQLLGMPENSILAQDLKTFIWFTENYADLLNFQPLELGDLRYSALPNGLQPLWGIRFDPQQPERHVVRRRFPFDRDAGLRALGQMLLGSAPGAQIIP